NGHFPRPDDCRSFHHCDRNVARIKLCPPLTCYDPRLHMCMFSSFVTCFKYEKYECPVDLPIGRYRNAKCDRYFLCVNGKSYLRYCPPFRSFDTLVNRCVLSVSANCNDQVDERVSAPAGSTATTPTSSGST